MSRKLALAALPVVFLLCLHPSAYADQKPWTEFKSPHFRVLTDGSDQDAYNVAAEFEQMRHVFEVRAPGYALDSGAPLTIFAARDYDSARKLDPEVFKHTDDIAGEFHHGWEKQFAVIRMDTWGEGAHEVVYHEYTHSILHLNSRWLPVWLDEGLAEFYGYTRFQSDKTYIGPPTERYGILKHSSLMPVMTVLEVDEASPYYHDPHQAEIFYADAWALVHYMTFGPGMNNGDLLASFYALLQKGVEQKKAFVQVFGDPAKFDKGWLSYTNRVAFSAGVIASAPPLDRSQCQVRKLTVAETELELGAFHVGAHDDRAGEPFIDGALHDDPKLGAAHEEKGFLLFHRGKDDEALKEFTEAYALDPSLFRSLFAKTMMSPEATSTEPILEDSYEADLTKVTQLNEKFAPAYIELAMLYLRERHFQAAFKDSAMAEKLEPSRAGYHLFSARILIAAGQGRDASPFATFVAERWLGPDHNEAVDVWNEIPPVARTAGTTLAYEHPGGNTPSVTGIVQSTHCGDGKEPFTVTISVDGKTNTYDRLGGFISGFSDTLWVGEDHFSLCHHLEGKPATVYFKPVADSKYAGELVSLEIRDNVVMPSANAAPGVKQTAASTP
jgi:Tfp pilus assembly protein PilF